MAIPLNLCIPLVLYFLLVSSYAATIRSKVSKPNSLLIPIKKTQSLQYYVTLQMANNLPSMKATIDLGGSMLLLDCDNYTSVSKRKIDCSSRICLDGPKTEECHGNNTCGVNAVNPFRGISSLEGSLEEEKIKVGSTDGVKYFPEKEVEHFAFSCVRYPDLRGVARGFMGMLGLAKTPVFFTNQLASLVKLPQKFALCIPSSNENGSGDLFIGGGPYYKPPYTKDISTSFIQTPLLTYPFSNSPYWSPPPGEVNYEYFIGVQAIRIGGRNLTLDKDMLVIEKDGEGWTKLSTIPHFTKLHTKIYKAVTSKFVKKFASMNVTRVAAVYPLEACFSTKNIGKSKTGLNVPVIDLVLQNDVTWRIYGHNSMKQVSKEVACLAFVDGGSITRLVPHRFGWTRVRG